MWREPWSSCNRVQFSSLTIPLLNTPAGWSSWRNYPLAQYPWYMGSFYQGIHTILLHCLSWCRRSKSEILGHLLKRYWMHYKQPQHRSTKDQRLPCALKYWTEGENESIRFHALLKRSKNRIVSTAFLFYSPRREDRGFGIMILRLLLVVSAVWRALSLHILPSEIDRQYSSFL